MATKFTAKYVENIKPAASRKEIRDAGAVGLWIVIQPSGARAWAFRFEREGKSRKVTLGSFPDMSLAEARAAAQEAHKKLRQGEDPAGSRAPKASATSGDGETVADLVERFVARQQRRGIREWADNARFLRKDVIPELGALPVATIRRRQLGDLLESIVARAPGTANQVHGLLRQLFTLAIERELIDASPMAHLQKPAPSKSRDRVLSDDELIRIWRAAERIGWPFGPMTQLLICTGSRRGEWAEAQWSEFNLAERTWTIPGRRRKTGEGQIVPLSDLALDLLERLPRVYGSPFLFPAQRGGTGTIKGFSRAKDILDRESGVADWRIHDIRRSVATSLQRLGIKLEVIEEILGHKAGTRTPLIRTYQRYSFAPEMRIALDAWARHLRKLHDPTSTADNVVALR